MHFYQPARSFLPFFLLTLSALLSGLSVVYRGVPWQHTAPTVPGHVQANGGRDGDVYGGDPECIQPSPNRTSQIRLKGNTMGVFGGNFDICVCAHYCRRFVFIRVDVRIGLLRV